MSGRTSPMASRLSIIEPSRLISASMSCGGTRSAREPDARAARVLYRLAPFPPSPERSEVGLDGVDSGSIGIRVRLPAFVVTCPLLFLAGLFVLGFVGRDF